MNLSTIIIVVFVLFIANRTFCFLVLIYQCIVQTLFLLCQSLRLKEVNQLQQILCIPPIDCCLVIYSQYMCKNNNKQVITNSFEVIQLSWMTVASSNTKFWWDKPIPNKRCSDNSISICLFFFEIHATTYNFRRCLRRPKNLATMRFINQLNGELP